MTPDEAPETTPDTPATPDVADTTDWQKRYSDLQPEYTRTTQALKAEQDLWEDDDALLARLREKRPDWVTGNEEEEDTPDYAEEDDDRPLTRAEWNAWQAEQEAAKNAAKAERQFETDLAEFVGERELSPHGEQFIQGCLAKGDFNGRNGAENLRKAVDGWFEYEDGLRGQAAPKPKDPPRVPHTPTTGQSATQVPNWDDMTRGEINQYMAEKVRASQAQT